MDRIRFIAAALAALSSSSARGDGVSISGAGSTFAAPLYNRWSAEYRKAHPDQTFGYQSVGSGGGIQQITARAVDFGATDSPMTDAELSKAPGLLHIPVALGAVAIVYNGLPDGLRLTPDVLADILLGSIRVWNDPRIAAANPDVKLPDDGIQVIHRSDSSGTTGVFTDYLSKVSPAWRSKVGAGKSVNWHWGLGGKGNEGVTGLATRTPHSIGYVELAYAKQNHLAMALLRNAEGAFVAPSVESTSAAAAGVALPVDSRVSITNASGKTSYPISSFTYALVYRDQPDAAKGKALVSFLWWGIHGGQQLAVALDYAPLPQPVAARVEQQLRTIQAQGQSLLSAR